MRKKISILLTVAILFTLVPIISVSAAETLVTLTIEPVGINLSGGVEKGTEVTFKVSLSASKPIELRAIQFDLDIPAGLTYKANSYKEDSAYKTKTGYSSVTFNENNKRFASLDITGAAYSYTTGKLDILTFTCETDGATINTPYTVTITGVAMRNSANVNLTAGNGTVDDNYAIQAANFTVKSAPTPITVEGIKAENKLDDGTDDAILDFSKVNIKLVATPTDIDIKVATLTDINVWKPIVVTVASGTDIIIESITGKFDDANVGTDKPITLTGVLSGTGSENYKLVFVDVLKADITTNSNATVPGTPTDLRASPANKQVTLTWKAPTSNGGSAIIGYNVYYSVGTATDILVTTAGKPTTTTSLSYTVTGLENGVPHIFSVRAVNAKGEGPAATIGETPKVIPGGGGGGGGGSVGGGGGGSSNTTSEPEKTESKPKPIIVDIDGMKFEATVDANGNLVITLSAEDIAKYRNDSGKFIITVTGYENIILVIDTEALEDDDLIIITDFGTMTIPNATLKEMQKLFGKDPLRLSIKKGSFNVALINSKNKEIPYNNPDYPFMITLPYTMKPAEKAEAVVAVRKVEKRNIIIPFAVYKEETENISFNVTRTGEYDAIYRQKDYKDVPGHWAEKYIDFITARGLEDYSTDGIDMFSPEQRLTRATVANMLATIEEVNLSKYNTSGFDDVPMGEWYSKAVAWAAEVGIVNGYEDGTFKPKQLVTREEIAVMLDRYIKYKGWDITEVNEKLAFKDNAKISSWATEAIDNIQQAGIINGKPGNMYDPKGITTRAEYVTIFARLIEAYSK